MKIESKPRRPVLVPLIAAVAATLALAACDRGATDNRTAGQRVDDTVAAAGDKAREVRDDSATAARDAAITAEVNAQLAKDPSLSALRIDVDTDAGRVALKGSAPSAEAKDRASQLARNVDGVKDVDNQLVIGNG